ncbi:MAG: FtsQ-type POTRA domain-containing protein [Alphaproteobacteria bacterium]|nr:FtsQ-type POTRA domain-containing protein [Alphaproteobacteria bacterium]
MAKSRAVAKRRGKPVTRQAATRARARKLFFRDWVRRGLVVTVTAGALSVVAWAGWFWVSGGMRSVAAGMSRGVVAMSAAAGVNLKHVVLDGREHTDVKEVQEAVALTRGVPLLSVSLEEIRARLEDLPWVRSASVERVLPSTLVIHLQERVPIALWQMQGRLALVDRDGAVIGAENVGEYAELPIIVGENAPKNTADLLQTLLTEEELYKRVTSAIRVGDRRWNVRFGSGIEVKLPEENMGEAWKYLADIERQQHVLARDVRILDLRIPGKLFVTMSPEGTARRIEMLKEKKI